MGRLLRQELQLYNIVVALFGGPSGAALLAAVEALGSADLVCADGLESFCANPTGGRRQKPQHAWSMAKA
jgi:hypothetical protein